MTCQVSLTNLYSRIMGILEELRAGFNHLESRISRVGGILEQVCNRLNNLEERLNHLYGRLDSGLREIRQRQDRWIWLTLGVLLPMWLTIILTIVFT